MDSDEFLSCDEGFDEFWSDDDLEIFENIVLDEFETTFCQEKHGTSGDMDWEWLRGLVGIEASSDPLLDAGGVSNPRWSTGKSPDFQRPG